MDFGGLIDQFTGGGGGRGQREPDIGNLIGGLISGGGGGGAAGGRYSGGGGMVAFRLQVLLCSYLMGIRHVNS